MNREEIIDILREEYKKDLMKKRTFVLDNEKALLTKRICEQLKAILDDGITPYTIDVHKTAEITKTLSIVVKTDEFNPAKKYMQIYRNLLEEVSEVAHYVEDGDLKIEFFIEDAYIQVD